MTTLPCQIKWLNAPPHFYHLFAQYFNANGLRSFCTSCNTTLPTLNRWIYLSISSNRLLNFTRTPFNVIFSIISMNFQCISYYLVWTCNCNWPNGWLYMTSIMDLINNKLYSQQYDEHQQRENQFECLLYTKQLLLSACIGRQRKVVSNQDAALKLDSCVCR